MALASRRDLLTFMKTSRTISPIAASSAVILFAKEILSPAVLSSSVPPAWCSGVSEMILVMVFNVTKNLAKCCR